MKSAIRPLGPAIGSRPGGIGRPRPQGVPRVVGPVNIPSIKAENNGLDPSVSLVPASASGWGQAANSSSSSAAKPGAWSASAAPAPAALPPSFSDSRRSEAPPRQSYPLERQQFPDLADGAASASGRSDSSGFISLRPQSFMDRQQGSSSGTFAQRDIERPTESHRSSRRHEDEYHEQQQGRVQYQQQRYPPPPLPSDRYDSRRAPSPPRSQQQQQQQHRQASDDANRRVSSGSTHDWADDDDGEMNFNEPLLIVSNRFGDASTAAASSSSTDDPTAQLLKEQARLQQLKLQQEMRRLQQQQGSESSTKDVPRQAWSQQQPQHHEQQQQQQQNRVGASDMGRKVWMDQDPYNRAQSDDMRRPQQQGGYMTHEQRFELLQRSGGVGAPVRAGASVASQQLYEPGDSGSQFRSNPWNRNLDAGQQQVHDGHVAADDGALSGGEAIAIGDDYTRAQQAPSGLQMLFNHRTGRLEPTQPPPKESSSRFHQPQQPQLRGWSVLPKPRPATADAAAAAAHPSRSILKAPAIVSSRAVPDAKSLREEASAEREQRRLMSGRSAEIIALGMEPSARPAAAAGNSASVSASVAAAADSVSYIDESVADESSIVNLLASEVAADYFQPTASTESSLSSTAAPYTRSAAPASAVASAASSGAGLLQPPQSATSTVWSPLHSNANVGAGLFQVFSSAPNEAAALPGWSNVTGSVAYGGQGSLQYGGAVQFNPAQWMQLGPTVTAEPIRDSEKYQHLVGLWNDNGQSMMQPQGQHHPQHQVSALTAQHQQQQQQQQQGAQRFGLWGAPQLGSLSNSSAAMGSSWLPPGAGTFQPYGEGFASSDRGYDSGGLSFALGPSSSASAPAAHAGNGAKMGRGGRGGSGAASARPANPGWQQDGGKGKVAPAAAAAAPSSATAASGNTAAAAARPNRRGRGGKGSENSSA